MKRAVRILVLIGILAFGWQVRIVQADVVIKVRALNPLDTQETAVINYPLPNEISQEDIVRQKITYSMDHTEDEEPPKKDFQISFDEKNNRHFIDDEIILLPKEVATLEVHVKDVWVIERGKIEELHQEVDGLLEVWEEQVKELQETATEEEKDRDAETKEFALMMKAEILDGLDKIMQLQDSNDILAVGVEKHISVYEKNIESLRQIQQDIVLLANLIQFDAQEEEGDEEELEDGELPEPDEPDEVVDNGQPLDEIPAYEGKI